MSTEKELSLDDFAPIAAPSVVGKIDVEDLQQKIGVKNQSGTIGNTHLTEEIVNNLDQQVDDILEIIINAAAHSKEMKDITQTLNSLGNADMSSSGSITSDFLTRHSLHEMIEDKDNGGESVAKGLSELRTKMAKLDPNARKNIFKKPSKLLGLLPFGLGQKTESYFKEFQNADEQLKKIVDSLCLGKDRLIEDNVQIDVDKEKLYNLMQHLEQYVYIFKKIDEKVESKLPEIEIKNKIKADNIKNEILFPLRQKRSDMLQQLAVSMQGYLTLQVARRNNVELIHSVDRITNVTMEALKIAIMVSEVLSSQKLVLKSINAVNEFGNSLIASNAEMLGQNATVIQEQATQFAINVDMLSKAFENTFKAMDQMDKYRIEALPKLKKTVDNLEQTIQGAKNYIETNRKANIADVEKKVAESIDEEENYSAIMKFQFFLCDRVLLFLLAK